MRITGVFVLLILIGIISGAIFFVNNKQSRISEDNPTSKIPAAAQDKKTIEENTKKAAEISQQTQGNIILLTALNNSKESGAAILSEENGKAVVSITLTWGYPKATPQPAHIHVGKCPGVGEIKYPLTDVINGSSKTILPISLSQLKQSPPLALNIHKSKQETSTYVSCGELQPADSSISPSAVVSLPPSISPVQTITPAN